jgi:hypothetical protein
MRAVTQYEWTDNGWSPVAVYLFAREMVVGRACAGRPDIAASGATARGRIETTKVEIERGVVKVDRRLQTGEPHVWAIDPGFRINLHTEGPKERTRSRA